MELANIAYSTRSCDDGSGKEAPQELAICEYNGEVPVFGSCAWERGRGINSMTVELKEDSEVRRRRPEVYGIMESGDDRFLEGKRGRVRCPNMMS